MPHVAQDQPKEQKAEQPAATAHANKPPVATLAMWMPQTPDGATPVKASAAKDKKRSPEKQQENKAAAAATSASIAPAASIKAVPAQQPTHPAAAQPATLQDARQENGAATQAAVAGELAAGRKTPVPLQHAGSGQLSNLRRMFCSFRAADTAPTAPDAQVNEKALPAKSEAPGSDTPTGMPPGILPPGLRRTTSIPNAQATTDSSGSAKGGSKQVESVSQDATPQLHEHGATAADGSLQASQNEQGVLSCPFRLLFQCHAQCAWCCQTCSQAATAAGNVHERVCRPG